MLRPSFLSDPGSDLEVEQTRARNPTRSGRPETVASAAMLGAFASIAAALVAARGFAGWSPMLVATLVALYALACNVEFEVGTIYTDLSLPILVAMMVLLPPAAIPWVIAAACTVSAVTKALVGRRHLSRVVPAVSQASLPVLAPVGVLAAAPALDGWSALPVVGLAILAYIAADLAVSIVFERIAYGIALRWPSAADVWVYLVDLLLAPVGFAMALAAGGRAWGLVVVFAPLAVLLRIFASERRRRIDHALELSRAYRGTAMLLGDVVEADDAYTGSHSRDVVELAVEVGRRMRLGAVRLRNLEFAALLHDVGKIRIPNEIVNKPGKLSAEEWEVMKRHTIDGQDMLEGVGGVLAEVGVIVRASHEDYDGSGYPDGLRGDAIPIEARICSACDALSAMTTDRSYRAAMSVEDAVDELRRCAGTQFDPQVVKILVEVLEESAAARVETAAPVALPA